MSELLRFFKDMRDNGYGLAEIAAQLGTSAIAEPVAGFAAMYDPQHGADAIREGMTYQPRSQAAQEYSQSVGNAAKTAIKPAMPIIDTWKKGVDIAGQYSPVVGATLRTVPTAIGIAMGAKPALQAGRQVSEGLGAMQGRMIANANAPRTLNTGFRGQRGAIGTQRQLTEFEQAHLTAQRNAALPVNQGGLGLPADNTSMDRARAMGWDIDTTYTHRSRNTSDYLQEINPKKDFGGIFSLADDDAGPRYGQHKHEFLLKGDVANNIADEYSDALLKKNFKEIVGHKSSSKISSNDMDTIRYALDNQSVYVDNPDRLYELLNGFDDVESFKAMQKTIGELSRKKGYGAVKMEDEFGDSTMLLHGNKVRYKDAAFDPFNRESSNLLATTAPLVPTTALGAYMYNENRKNTKGKQ
jgi:hypothetical protein